MIILGLGSNFGNREGYLQQAVNILNQNILAAMEVSSIYESMPVLKEGSPIEWNNLQYLNMAVRGESHLSPSDLLKKIKMIENQIGRQSRGTWAPREIDIDILAYDDLFINNDELTIPHAHLYKRPFALLPLTELAPNWQCPVGGAFKGKTAYDISDQLFKLNNGITKTELVISPEQEAAST